LNSKYYDQAEPVKVDANIVNKTDAIKNSKNPVPTPTPTPTPKKSATYSTNLNE
jgi:hypothetical protein